jgi:hypothetical protein
MFGDPRYYLTEIEYEILYPIGNTVNNIDHIEVFLESANDA